jgi:OOP family OmpA-OmpF porin
MNNAGLLPNPGVLTFSAGYYFNSNVGVEVGYAFVGDSIVNYCDPILGCGSATLSQSAFKVAALGTVPVSPQIDIFGKVGLAMITAQLNDTVFGISTSATTTNLMYGVGGLFHINKNMGVRVQYENLGKTKADPFAIGSDVSVFSAGFVYSF